MRLYAESFAPWCEKARWALDHHGVRYKTIDHLPLVGEITLRIAMRRLRGRVTVPALLAGRLALMDSLEIAHYAERVGHGAPLFPHQHKADVVAWHTHSEIAMAAGRALLLPRLAQDDAALAEQVPALVPASLRPGLKGAARLAVRHLMRKYGVDPAEANRDEAILRRVLASLRESIRTNGTHLVAGTLTYADISLATALQFIAPVEDGFIRLGTATRRAWTHATLGVEFADLLSWRDGLYAGYRYSISTRATRQ